jgi:hypothetical protein
MEHMLLVQEHLDKEMLVDWVHTQTQVTTMLLVAVAVLVLLG